MPASPGVVPQPRLRGAFWPLWAAAVLVPLLTLAGGAAWSWRAVQAEAQARLLRTVDMLYEHAARAFETQDTLLAAVQQHTARMTWEEIRASREVAAFIRSIDSAAAGTSALGMVGPDARLAHISIADFPPRPIELADRDYVEAQRGPAPGYFVGELVVARVTGQAVFNLSRPRLDATGRPDGGVIWGTFRHDAFADFYAAVIEAAADTITLVRDDGAVLARYPPLEPLIGRRVPASSPQVRAVLQARNVVGGATLVDGVSPLDGERRLYAARHLPGKPIAVVYGLHPDGLRHRWLGQVAIIAAVAGALLLLLLWLTWLVQRRTRGEAAALAKGRAEAERRAAAETARAEAEASLRTAQRLEVLGELAAGVAHDFRNTVQAVQGGVSLACKALAAGDAAKARTLLGLIAEAAGRGATLTDRMLQVARHRQAGGQPNAAFELRPAFDAAVDLLARMLPAGYPVLVDAPPAGLPARVCGDVAEFEAALLNLAVNARDAMPRGGSIRIRLGVEPQRVEVGCDGLGEVGPGAGRQRQVSIAITDAGIGMDAATLARAVEPFFTTKPSGRGTGLGLSSVQAFVRAAGGAMRVESPGPGCGSTVTLLLPEAPSG